MSVQRPPRMDFVNPSKPGRIIELGCHAGYNLVHWAQEHPDTVVVGVDISDPLIEEANKRVVEAGLESRAVAIHSFIEDLSPADFDSMGVGNPTDIVLTETLEHVQDPEPVLHSAINLMSAETSLWITVPAIRWGNYSHVRGIAPKQLHELAATSDKKVQFLVLEKRGADTLAIIKLNQ